MNSSPEPIDFGTKTGICVKSSDGRVLKQNPLCESLCGPCVGKICQKGCMTLFRRSETHPTLNEGIRVFRGARLDEYLVDLAIIEDGVHVTTLLHPLGTKISRELAALKGYGLSKRESEITSFLLRGFTNSQLAKKLSISVVTLKTHLNNIYKKLPPNLREDIRALKPKWNECLIQSG